ncbi:hypothetical protein I7I50_00928 [Histoplasma capsulatum G186AR]|uniref:Uncharacterized protein n=1 Tax=Ajellomyces capsulatus TaxID=5037 RepID=A0A8H8CV65_AJECA|nr:hypothetical protein I7I52_08194 [Histoplasma capsulatum]QSS72930.1 hypothetical protein I7I50_00928 [Histoplasma capsulatum G186AR]
MYILPMQPRYELSDAVFYFMPMNARVMVIGTTVHKLFRRRGWSGVWWRRRFWKFRVPTIRFWKQTALPAEKIKIKIKI